MSARRRALTWGAFVLAGILGPAAAADAQLIVLTPTGEMRDGLPVLLPHPDAEAVVATLTRGFSSRLLHLYALEQEFLRRKTGRKPEPAYLLLSDRRGGFPQFGFFLGDERKAGVGFVDLHRSSTVSGRFGAMDQIFPHELLHVIVRQLAGEPRQSGGNQMHAVGVRSDPVAAFSEGFAEHAQIVAVDDPDATPDTRVLVTDVASRERASAAVNAYARDLERRWWPVQPARLRFLLWFSHSEQVQRYASVKANLFAHDTDVPATMSAPADAYSAYLLRSIVPGRPDSAPKPAGAMLSTEGVVAHLFWRLVTDTALQERYADDTFFELFGTTRAEVSPLDNVYLKIFAALDAGRPSTAAELLRAWAQAFPADAPDLDRITRAALLGQPVPDAPEIWLANDALITGTSLFDQYRGLPRVHTFDANAATTFDWMSVPGVTPAIAARLVAGAPYQTFEALQTSAAVSPLLRSRLSDMSAAMTQLRARAADAEETLGLWAIARPYLWRFAAIVFAATLSGGWLARRAGARRTWTAGVLAFAATLLVVVFAWIVTSPPSYPFAAPIVLGGLPWSLWRWSRRRSLPDVLRPLAIWGLASMPALLLTLV